MLMLVGLVGPVSGDTESKMSLTTVDNAVYTVSHDGRWVADNTSILDRLTGATTPVNESSEDQWFAGFVRDNPKLWLVVPELKEFMRLGDESVVRYYPHAGVYLLDSSSGQRKRIDTDAAGAPLVPTWTGPGCRNVSDDCYYTAGPGLRIAAGSISRDGGTAAFCSNYADPNKPLLYVKDLVSGRLTVTTVRCGVDRFEADENPVQEAFHWPEISEDARVIHVKGDTLRDWQRGRVAWQRDSLYFPASGKVRTASGQGTMTRDGGTIYLRMGAQAATKAESAPRKVGAYNVATRRTTRLRWWNTLLGDEPAFFGPQPEMMTRRGRYLLGANFTLVDSKAGISVDVASLLRERGYTDEFRIVISGDGRTLFAMAFRNSFQWARLNGQAETTLALTDWGWQHQVRARVSSEPTALFVDVDPNRGGGYWEFAVERLNELGEWETLPGIYRTKGRNETRTVNLAASAYRVRVLPKYGYRGYISGKVFVPMG
jgi:hypothetical protein